MSGSSTRSNSGSSTRSLFVTVDRKIEFSKNFKLYFTKIQCLEYKERPYPPMKSSFGFSSSAVPVHSTAGHMLAFPIPRDACYCFVLELAYPWGGHFIWMDIWKSFLKNKKMSSNSTFFHDFCKNRSKPCLNTPRHPQDVYKINFWRGIHFS